MKSEEDFLSDNQAMRMVVAGLALQAARQVYGKGAPSDYVAVKAIEDADALLYYLSNPNKLPNKKTKNEQKPKQKPKQ